MGGGEFMKGMSRRVRRGVSGCATREAHDAGMNTKPTDTKKTPAATGKRKARPAPRWPMYPESYVHARGRSSGWRSSERNA